MKLWTLRMAKKLKKSYNYKKEPLTHYELAVLIRNGFFLLFAGLLNGLSHSYSVSITKSLTTLFMDWGMYLDCSSSLRIVRMLSLSGSASTTTNHFCKASSASLILVSSQDRRTDTISVMYLLILNSSKYPSLFSL